MRLRATGKGPERYNVKQRKTDLEQRESVIMKTAENRRGRTNKRRR